MSRAAYRDIQRETPPESLWVCRKGRADDGPERWPSDDGERVGHDGGTPFLRRKEVRKTAANCRDRRLRESAGGMTATHAEAHSPAKKRRMTRLLKRSVVEAIAVRQMKMKYGTRMLILRP